VIPLEVFVVVYCCGIPMQEEEEICSCKHQKRGRGKGKNCPEFETGKKRKDTDTILLRKKAIE
jgi:hypothetical protein